MNYFVSTVNLKHTNVYPYFVHLATSSKQSKHVLKLANAIKAENQLFAKLKNAKIGKYQGYNN